MFMCVSHPKKSTREKNEYSNVFFLVSLMQLVRKANKHVFQVSYIPDPFISIFGLTKKKYTFKALQYILSIFHCMATFHPIFCRYSHLFITKTKIINSKWHFRWTIFYKNEY